MKGIIVSTATGVMNSLLTKHITLLGEYKELQKEVKRDVDFLKDELSSMNALFEKLADTEMLELDPQVWLWKNQIRSVVYIDVYMPHQDSDKSRFISEIAEKIRKLRIRISEASQKKVKKQGARPEIAKQIRKLKTSIIEASQKKVKKQGARPDIAKQIRKLKTSIIEASQRRDRYKLYAVLDSGRTVVVPIDPWLYAEESSLVGTDVPRATGGMRPGGGRGATSGGGGGNTQQRWQWPKGRRRAHGMNSHLTKPTTLLGEEYKLQNKVKRDVAFLKDALSSVNALLETLANIEVLNPQQEWRNKVREMAYDIQDCIDQEACHEIKKVKKQEACHEIARQISKRRDGQISKRRDRYAVLDSGSSDVVPIDPRLSALYAEASNLVGTDVPRDELIKLVDDGEKSLKVVSIVGLGGLGKTTLANQVYQKVGEQFDCRAFVSVSQKPNFLKILRSILFQIGKQEYERTESGNEECLINALRDFLKDKRYFIVIDDIWSTQAWKIIKCALLENTCGSRILVTTRIAVVAKSCCSPRHDLVYELRPLSERDSKSLFLRRVFGSEDNCPLQLKKVSTEIIRKCGGLPLAIIMMSSLLTTKSDAREEWLMVLNSICLGPKKNSDVKKMKTILSLSYNDLPPHLRTCLLYLSMFPEDYEIWRDRLVSRWIAEGFVKVDGGRNLMEEGECYFNELINRSMIQPVHIQYDGRVNACRVHDMILDLIISKAVEENFITSVGDQSKIRRLSLDYRGQENVIVASSMVTGHVRSLSIFGYSVQIMPSISDLHALRVLDIETTGILENCNLRNIGKLFQLRYLRIEAKSITNLPEQIGELQYLKTLDLWRTGISELPASIVKLRRLKRLLGRVKLPDGVGNMQALEELGRVFVNDESSINSLQELGKLTKLRTLHLVWCIGGSHRDTYADILASSLGKLCSSNLRCLHVRGSTEGFRLDSWSSPARLLRELDVGACYLKGIPEWMASLANLTLLIIRVNQVTQETFQILGDLPALLKLALLSEADGPSKERLIVCSGGFQRLKYFYSMASIMFEAGAMPKLEELTFVTVVREVQSACGLGIHHLSALRRVHVSIDSRGARVEEVEAWKASIKNEASLLPNRPTPSFGTYEEDKIGLWGANTGTLHDIEGVPGRLKSVTIRSGEVIYSLALGLLEKVTGGFSEENKIGSGGYGKVYKGILNGREIAVKKLQCHPAIGDVIFKNECENLMRVRHQNIVELVGYCHEIRHRCVERNGRTVYAEMVDRVLCFEYLQNGSLDKHLYEEDRGLDWCTRYKIIKGICEGLNYLHGLEESILHLDLKPANILLDENMVPKIADFGLSRLFGETHTHITKNLAGTGMYMPPEYIRECKITKKYDVFSLGVIIIQIMTGPKGYSEYGEMSPQQFIELVHQNWKVRVEAEATSMHTSAGEDCKQVKRCIEIALNCVVTEREKRPTIGDIIHKLIETETMKQKDSSNEQPGSLEKEYQEDTKKRAASGIYEVSTPFSQELESVSRQFGRAVAHDEKEVRSELEAMKEERGGGGGMQESRSVGGRIEMEVVHGEKELWSNKLETIKQERGGKQEAAFSKIGPWGGSAGRAHSIKVAPHRLESVTIWSADIVDAFAFSYSDHNGNKHTIGPFGGPGGRVYRIEFAPSEFLLEVSGTIGSYAWAVADVVQTITLVTNASSYGPFGQVGGGTPFHTSIQSNDRIVGFFGRGGMFVHAIGVYVRHFERKMVQGGKEVIFGLDEEALAKIGPWGGNGGMAYDMKVAPHRLESLTICCGVVIDSLAFSYDDLNGKQHTMGPWGGPGGNTYTIRLGPFEFLSGVSGTVGSFGTIPNVITSLMFTTNHGRSYGPLGQGGGTSFRIPVENNGCIVGFFGRAGSCVEALGVYIRTH